ncbi:MAG: hypothetical protein AABZ55_01270, partial [Bdellovibrionota bacterium]
MKTTITLIAFSFLAGPFSQASIPTHYQLECIDGTFAYNHLKVTKSENNLILQSSGQDGRVFSHLTGTSDWGNYIAEMSVEN